MNEAADMSSPKEQSGQPNQSPNTDGSMGDSKATKRAYDKKRYQSMHHLRQAVCTLQKTVSDLKGQIKILQRARVFSLTEQILATDKILKNRLPLETHDDVMNFFDDDVAKAAFTRVAIGKLSGNPHGLPKLLDSLLHHSLMYRYYLPGQL